MGVVRVRAAGVGAPLTEFDVPRALFERSPGRYVLVDGVERSVPMRASFPEPEPEPVEGDATHAALVEAVKHVRVERPSGRGKRK